MRKIERVAARQGYIRACGLMVAVFAGLFSTQGAAAIGKTCTRNADCNDSQFCNGTEVCSASTNGLRCAAGTPPTCASGTYCEESTDSCASVCRVDNDCSNGQFCDGVERCMPGSAFANAKGCGAPAAPACSSGQSCNETSDSCLTNCAVARDADGDGVISVACGGTDCDDGDPNRFPGNREVCNVSEPGHDEDCDATTVGKKDTDEDGYVDYICSNAHPAGGQVTGSDCNDNDPVQHPTEAETCNGKDDDCNGEIDEGLLVAMYPDADGDGYGRFGATAVQSCPGRSGYSPLSTDCDDTNPKVYPGVMTCTGTLSPRVNYCSPTGQVLQLDCDASLGARCVTQPNQSGVCIPTSSK